VALHCTAMHSGHSDGTNRLVEKGPSTRRGREKQKQTSRQALTRPQQEQPFVAQIKAAGCPEHPFLDLRMLL